MACLKMDDLQGYLDDPDASSLREKVDRHLRRVREMPHGVRSDCRDSTPRQCVALRSRVAGGRDIDRCSRRIYAVRSFCHPGQASRPAACGGCRGNSVVPIAVRADSGTIRVSTRAASRFHSAPHGNQGHPGAVCERSAIASDVGRPSRRSVYAADGGSHSSHALLQVGRSISILDPQLKAYVPELKPQFDTVRGGGGGGAREALTVSQGRLPRVLAKQFVPPQIVNHAPKLTIDATLIPPPDTPLPQCDFNNGAIRWPN
jgi:hypothetical protein